MRTYIPDQWLRNWFLGGPEVVDYTNCHQINHKSPGVFADDLRQVWRNAAAVSSDDAKLVVRFGGITSRRANPLAILKDSLSDSGWQVMAIFNAGSAIEGRRQADTFLRGNIEPTAEYDVWSIKEGAGRRLRHHRKDENAFLLYI
jgi:hypothetical protein